MQLPFANSLFWWEGMSRLAAAGHPGNALMTKIGWTLKRIPNVEGEHLLISMSEELTVLWTNSIGGSSLECTLERSHGKKYTDTFLCLSLYMFEWTKTSRKVDEFSWSLDITKLTLGLDAWADQMEMGLDYVYQTLKPVRSFLQTRVSTHSPPLFKEVWGGREGLDSMP